jgi:hypothetical protein
MMPGSGDPTPYGTYVLVALCVLAGVLLLGGLFGPRWASGLATGLRRGALYLAILVFVAVFIVTPTPYASWTRGRLITLWPAFLAMWSWRIGHVQEMHLVYAGWRRL